MPTNRENALILIVDDDESLCNSLRRVLSKKGYQVEIALRAKSAMEKFQKNVFNLVLLDIKLPDMSGIELMNWMKELSLQTELIVITGYASLNSAITAVNKGAFAYVEKPLEMEYLLSLVERALEKQRLKRQLEQSEDRYRTLYEGINDAIFVHDFGGNLIAVNQVACQRLGYSGEELLSMTWREIIQGFAGEERMVQIIDAKESVLSFETVLRRKDGELIPVEIISRKISYEGNPAILSVAHDITERRQAEEQARASLREKEMLLDEIQHRVRNNLQLISGLLDMSSMRTRNPEVIDLITDARTKIHIMALIHNQLYRSERFDQIDMESHIKEMVRYLSQVHDSNREKLITPVIQHSDVYLSVTQAIPCALALNEVISNAFKHAFPEGKKGTIEISIQRSADDMIIIRVKDNGIGIPEGIDIYRADSLGLKLIRNLVQEQLKGKVQVNRDNGTEFIIKFKNLKK